MAPSGMARGQGAGLQNPAKMSRFRIDAEGASPLYPRSPPGRATPGRTNFLAVTMFAVIKTGGKQYRVAKDDVIVVEKLDGKAGSKVTFKDVLMSGDGSSVKLGKDLSGQVVGLLAHVPAAAGLPDFVALAHENLGEPA